MYTLTIIAESGARFADFGPYVPAINDAATVAFQARLADAGTGVFCGSGGRIDTIVDPGGPAGDIVSHPDINDAGDCCFYAEAGGAGGVYAVRSGTVVRLADSHGPLGPTMNQRGQVAFRDVGADGTERIRVGEDVRAAIVAQTGGVIRAFQGVPVINAGGDIVLRVDRGGGEGIIVVTSGGQQATVVSTGDAFVSLGAFPCMNDAGIVGFCGVRPGGESGVFAWTEGHVSTVCDADAFACFRSVLLDDQGRAVFCATPRGGGLGVFAGPHPERDFVIRTDRAFCGSQIVDFALNVVSINRQGQLAIRVRLADERQMILRADPDVDTPRAVGE